MNSSEYLLLKYIYNLGQNICRLFQVLALFGFTTSETELDYFHQKVNIRVAFWVAESFRKLGSFKKVPEMLGIDGPLLYPLKSSENLSFLCFQEI